MERMKVAFLTNGTSPVPATKGGAVENLIEDLLDENEKRHGFDFTVFSLYEEKAKQQSKKYKNTNFYFVNPPKMIDCLDKGIYCIAKKMLKKKNLISYRYILRRLYVMSRFPKILLENNFDRLVLVTNSTLFFVLKDKKVAQKYGNKTIYYLHNEVRSLFGCEKEAASIRCLIGISEFVNDSFRKQVPALKKEQCYVLKNGIDTVKFTTRDERKIKEYKNKYGITEKDFVVVFAGRLVDEKGALETIRAIKSCNDSESLENVNRPYYVYRMDGNSATHKKFTRETALNNVNAARKIENILRESNDYDSFLRYLRIKTAFPFIMNKECFDPKLYRKCVKSGDVWTFDARIDKIMLSIFAQIKADSFLKAYIELRSVLR